MKNYTFFSYESNEALHLSEQERKVILDCFHNIESELQHAIDKHSKTLIVNNIELFLNYCVRFYDRQFITRSHVNKDILTRFENLLNDYFQSEKPQIIGLPSVQYCADSLHLSPNYFGDLIKKETGNSAQEYIQAKLIGVAKVFSIPAFRSVKLLIAWDSSIHNISVVYSSRKWVLPLMSIACGIDFRDTFLLEFGWRF